jgi:hypothetical protein
MPVKLSTTVNKIPLIVNSTNVALIKEFYEYLKNTGASEKHINNNLKVIMNFANHIDPNTTFFDVQRREQIIKYSSKNKSATNNFLTSLQKLCRKISG